MTRPVVLFVLIAALVLSMVPATADTLDNIRDRGIITVGVKADYGAWGSYNSSGAITGMEPDIAAHIADALGVSLRLVPVTSANRLARLEQGAVDLVIATMGATVERRKAARLILPHYYASGVRLLKRSNSPFAEWGQLRGRSICLVRGAYYNRHLSESLLIEPLTFSTLVDAKAALRDGRCAGLAYDDTALAGMVVEPGWEDFEVAMPTINGTPWAMAVARGPETRQLARRIGDLVAAWHADGTLLSIEKRWLGTTSPFLEEMQTLWSRQTSDGMVCRRGPEGAFPEDCLISTIARSGRQISTPDWVDAFDDATGLDVTVFFDPYNRSRLLTGLANTIAISITAILGACLFGIGMAALLLRTASGPSILAPIDAAARGIVALAQLTPPILQIYILFFGLTAWLHDRTGVQPGAFAIASLVFSAYAGATIAVLLRAEVRQNPDIGLIRAFLGSYDGIVATLVNIVKAAGMASAVAYFDMITATTDLVGEGADKALMMNLLLGFYLVFVMTIMAFFEAIRRWLE